MADVAEIIDERVDSNIENSLEIFHYNIRGKTDYPWGMRNPGRERNEPTTLSINKGSLPEKHNNRSEVDQTSPIAKIPRETKICTISPLQSKMKIKAGYAKQGKMKRNIYKGTNTYSIKEIK